MQKLVEKNLEGCLWPQKDILLKLAEEVGELVQAVRKKTDEDVEGEIGDVLFAILAFCIARNVDAESCLSKTITTHLKKLSKTWDGDQAAEETREVLEESKGGMRMAELTAEETSGDSTVVPPGRFTSKGIVPLNTVVIGSDGRCVCDCATRCPIGKTGMTSRCTEQELRAAGVFTVSQAQADTDAAAAVRLEERRKRLKELEQFRDELHR